MRCSALFLTAAVTLTLATGVDARGRTFEGPHVRPLDAAGAALVADAQQKSATVRELFKQLEASDLVVYVRVPAAATSTPEAGFSFISTSKAARFVLISVSGEMAAARRIELLGHELQHAVEVARTPWVTGDAQLQQLMAIIGWRDASNARGYETSAASRIERQVRKDVHGIVEPR